MAHKTPGSRRGAQTIRPVSLSEQIKKMLRHRLVLLTSIAVCAVLAALVSLVTGSKYEATSTVVVYALTPDPNAQVSSQMQVDIDTEAAVAGSRQVAEVAAAKIDPNDPDLVSNIRGGIEVSAHSGTAVFDVAATAGSAEDAAAYANAVAEAYLEVRQQSLKEEISNTAELIRNSITAANESGGSGKEALEQRLAQVETTSTTAGRVVTTAQEPKSSSSLALWKYVLVGIVAGGLIGAVLSWIIDTRSRSVSYRDRAEDLLETDVFSLRPDHELEDTRRALRTLGNTGNLTQISVYSPSSTTSRRLNHLVQQAAPTAEVVLLAPDSEISDLLESADRTGACLMGITADTQVSQLQELSQLIETSQAQFLYLYLNQ